MSKPALSSIDGVKFIAGGIKWLQLRIDVVLHQYVQDLYEMCMNNIMNSSVYLALMTMNPEL